MLDKKTNPEIKEKPKVKKSYKKYTPILLILLVVIIAVVIIVNLTSTKYDKKIALTMDALNSEEKMNDALKNAIDVKGAIAWQNTEGDAKKFEEKLKEVKNENIEEGKNAFLSYSTQDTKIKTKTYDVKSVDKATKNKDNGKIKEVNAKINKKEYKFYFYNGKIIDIKVLDDDESIFKYILWSYNQEQ